MAIFSQTILCQILDDHRMHSLDTGLRFHFYHIFALLVTAIYSRYFDKKWARVAGWLFFTGIILFSGSLYLIAGDQFFDLEESHHLLDPFTPVGGGCLILGWASLLRASFNQRRR